MNSDKTADTQQRAARVAGFMYLFIIITPLLSLIFVDSNLIVEGDTAATANNIMANELLFRIRTAVDLIMYASEEISS